MVTIVKDIKEADGITHNGTMHADEVFATAFLDLYFNKFKVARVNSISTNDLPNTIIYDIGKGKFDHHQSDAKIRENGIKYSSFGLLFEEYGLSYLNRFHLRNKETIYNYFVKDFVEAIDAIDNGIFPTVNAPYKVKTVSDIIKLFNTTFLSNDNEDEQFLSAVSVAKTIFLEELKTVVAKVYASRIIESMLEETKGSLLVLKDFYLPYEETVLNSSNGEKIKLVIYPSNRGGYAIKTLPISVTNKTNRVYFPKEWAGKTKDELEELIGLKGVNFCHINRFLVATEDLETALKVADITLNINEQD